jgi:hypothetical protein
MMVATMAFIPINPASAAVDGRYVTVEVKDGTGHLTGATVFLSDPYGMAASLSGVTGLDGNATFGAMPGIYQLKVNATNHFDYQLPGTIRVDGLHDVHQLVTLDSFVSIHQVTFNVTSGGHPVAGPSITLRSASHGAATTLFSAQGTSGSVDLTIPAGTYKMVAQASNHLTNVSNVTVLGATSKLNVTLTAKTTYNYTVHVSGPLVPIDLRGMLVIRNATGVDPLARTIEGRTNGQDVYFDAPQGTYDLLISADNARTAESTIVVAANGTDQTPIDGLTAVSCTTTSTFG